MSNWSNPFMLRTHAYLKRFKGLLGDGTEGPYDFEHIASLIVKRDADHAKAIVAAVAAERARCVAVCRKVAGEENSVYSGVAYQCADAIERGTPDELARLEAWAASQAKEKK